MVYDILIILHTHLFTWIHQRFSFLILAYFLYLLSIFQILLSHRFHQFHLPLHFTLMVLSTDQLFQVLSLLLFLIFLSPLLIFQTFLPIYLQPNSTLSLLFMFQLFQYQVLLLSNPIFPLCLPLFNLQQQLTLSLVNFLHIFQVFS